MTADVQVLTHPGRLADLARPGQRRTFPWRVYAATCGPFEVRRALAMAIKAADVDTTVLRTTAIRHFITGPADAPARLEMFRTAVLGGRVYGLSPDDIDRAQAQLQAEPARWLVDAGARVITPQLCHLARWC